MEPAQRQFTLVLLRFRHHEQAFQRRQYSRRDDRTICQLIVENDLDIGARPHLTILQDGLLNGNRYR
jgi:hypothetical protein